MIIKTKEDKGIENYGTEFGHIDRSGEPLI